MPKPFKIYRIVCLITDKSLISGSDLPHHHLTWRHNSPQWYHRGYWSQSDGTFWKGEQTVRRHLQNLCHDWERHWDPHIPTSTWLAPIPNSLDWSRLKSLEVQQFLVTDYTVTKLAASDFMGIPDQVAA